LSGLWLDPRFDDCGFLKVKVHKHRHITDHGIKLKGGFLFTVFTIHKLIFTAGLLAAIINDASKSGMQ
jgi:hypothetical protein